MPAINGTHHAEDDSGRHDPAAEAARLHAQITSLLSYIEADSAPQRAAWAQWVEREEFAPSADNLARYLSLRRQDLRGLQRALTALGLSSLGRLESRVQPNLQSVRAALAALAGMPRETPPHPREFFAGEEALRRRALELFGAPAAGRPSALLVTLPSEAAADPGFVRSLAERGVEAVRINCAHDHAEAWSKMISHVREAERATGRRMKVLMDLAGPKIRTGAGRALHGAKRAVVGDRLAVVAPGGLAAEFDADVAFAVECTLPEALAAAAPGHHLFIDDGKIQCVVERTATAPPMIVARINRCKEGGAKLKPEKGLNFPDSDLRVPALTAKDAEDLLFAAANADGISYSFVQEPDDVALLQDALAALDPAKARRLPVILKIETARAVRNLPDILVRAAGRQPAALMIARGDLAIELGFARTAEMQEEILWLGEAAGVPVIWATQVLENLVKGGLRSRGEETDAAMGARAECIMLNKGPFILDAISDLDVLLARMEEHVHKKTPQLRKLVSWQGSSGTIAAGIDGEAANGTQA